MASSSHPSDSDKWLKIMPSSLLSPPETKRLESFSSPQAFAMTRTPQSSFSSDNSLPPIRNNLSVLQRGDAYASPPISPYEQPQKENVTYVEEDGAVRDPQLFVPGDANATLPPDVPLFPSEHLSPEVENLLDEHMAKSATKFSKSASKPPSREDYVLAISCVSTVAKHYNKNPKAWLKQEQEFYSWYGPQSRVQKRTPLKKLAPAPTSGSRKPKVAAPAPRAPRAARPVKRTPQTRVYDSFESFGVSSPKPARPPTNRDDVDYRSLPEFSPPLSTLPKGTSKALKADWKGQMLDLSADPDRHLLHEAELNLAATLRLSCATYLCSKRRIFLSVIDALRIGKPYRKTDAQQACKIDVNKASKIWSAYDKVGWFGREYFEQYL